MHSFRKIFVALCIVCTISILPAQVFADQGGVFTAVQRNITHHFIFSHAPFPASYFLHFTQALGKTENAYKRLLYELGRVSERKIELFLPEEEAETQLNIWLWGDTAEVYKQYFDRFERKYPQLSLNLVTFADQNVYFSELKKAFQRGNAPDIFLVDQENFLELKENKKLLPAPSALFSAQNLREDFYPIAQEFVEGESVLSAPLFGNFIVMLSNRPLLTDDRVFVGQKPGKTWFELFQNFQKFTEFQDEKKILPVSLGDPEFSPLSFEVFLTLLSQSQTNNFHQKGALDALSFLLSFAKDIPSSISKKGEETSFLEGKIGVLFGNENTVSRIRQELRNNADVRENDLKEENLELHLLPQFDTQNMQTHGVIWGLGVASDTEYGDFAWSLVETLTASQQKAKEHLLRTGKTPLIKGVQNEIFSESAAYAVSGGEWQDVDLENLFVDNALAHLEPPKKQDPRPLEDILNNFADFFSQNNAQEKE